MKRKVNIKYGNFMFIPNFSPLINFFSLQQNKSKFDADQVSS